MFIYGRKAFIGATRCSIDTCKWLEYLLQSLGKCFIRLKHIKIFETLENQTTKLSKKKLQNMTIDLPSYIFRVHTLILLASFFIHFVFSSFLFNCMNRERLTLFVCSIS